MDPGFRRDDGEESGGEESDGERSDGRRTTGGEACGKMYRQAKCKCAITSEPITMMLLISTPLRPQVRR